MNYGKANIGIFQTKGMREFVFTLSYERGVDTLVDAFINYPDVTALSTTCVATADHMWRVDNLFGPESGRASCRERVFRAV